MGLDFAAEVFQAPGMSQTSRTVTDTGSVSLAGVQVQLLSTSKTRARARRLLAKHHYLGDVRAVGEQLFTAAFGSGWGCWFFCAACVRGIAIGWTEEQRRRRRWSSTTAPPLEGLSQSGIRSLRLTLDRLSADWQAAMAIRLSKPSSIPNSFATPFYHNGWQNWAHRRLWPRAPRLLCRAPQTQAPLCP